jgi:hypothetical protein
LGTEPKLKVDVLEHRMYIEVGSRRRPGKNEHILVHILLLGAAPVAYGFEGLDLWNAPTDDVRSRNHLDERHTPPTSTALNTEVNGIFVHGAPRNRQARALIEASATSTAI